MQLKKRFSVRKSVAAGAMAVAMFAASMPAMASNGLGLGLNADLRLERDEAKSLGQQIKAELKGAKQDLKAAAKLEAKLKLNASATTTPEKTYVVAPSQAAAREPRAVRTRRIIPIPAASQCRAGYRRIAAGKDSIERAGRTG